MTASATNAILACISAVVMFVLGIHIGLMLGEWKADDRVKWIFDHWDSISEDRNRIKNMMEGKK